MHDSQAGGRNRSTVTTAAMLALAALLGALTLAGCGSDAPTGNDPPNPPETPDLADPPPDGAAAVATITAPDLATRVGIIAHDSMMGRWTPTPELLKAAGYLAAELDHEYRMRVFNLLIRTEAQLFLTALDRESWITPSDLGARMFHVEHGNVSEMV